MHITYISIFPEIYNSFLETSLIKKAREKGLLSFDLVNPRDFCPPPHNQIDDEIYGGGAGMLMKAQPLVEAVEQTIVAHNLQKATSNSSRKILFLSPSKEQFNQAIAYEYSELTHIIFVSGRYEGIDYRFEEYLAEKYPLHYSRLSIGQFVTLGGELPSMTITEAIVRLVPGVIKEADSHLLESYNPQQNMQNIEYPQYTRPEEIFGNKVPEVLLSGNHALIQKWRDENMK